MSGLTEQHDRQRQLQASVELARHDPPRLVADDLLDSVADLVSAVPSGTTVAVFGSAVLT
ncbi:DUF2332 family protein [Nocardia sp. CDC160]|uniref:DUF2332 family protein n=1 Tax=Nocardia sp. CDC160 TaxID=3112166 RepID=UPI003FA37F68